MTTTIVNGSRLGACFVWVRGLRGPEPQKWDVHPAALAISDHWKEKGGRVLAIHALGAEHVPLDLDELAALFPAPGQEADGEVVKLEGASS